MELDWEAAQVAFDNANKRLAKSKKAMRKAVRELKKELKAELNAVDELNANIDSLVIANASSHSPEGH
jgi:prefoldin subunit 5